MRINWFKYQTMTANTCNLFIYILRTPSHIYYFTFYNFKMASSAISSLPLYDCQTPATCAVYECHPRILQTHTHLDRYECSLYTPYPTNRSAAKENKQGQSAILYNFSLEARAFQFAVLFSLSAFEV